MNFFFCDMDANNEEVHITLEEGPSTSAVIERILLCSSLFDLKFDIRKRASAIDGKVAIVFFSPADRKHTIYCLKTLIRAVLDSKKVIPWFLSFDQIEVREYFLSGVLDARSNTLRPSKTSRRNFLMIGNYFYIDLIEGLANLACSLGISVSVCCCCCCSTGKGKMFYTPNFPRIETVALNHEALSSICRKMCSIDIGLSAVSNAKCVRRCAQRQYFSVKKLERADFFGFQFYLIKVSLAFAGMNLLPISLCWQIILQCIIVWPVFQGRRLS